MRITMYPHFCFPIFLSELKKKLSCSLKKAAVIQSLAYVSRLLFDLIAIVVHRWAEQEDIRQDKRRVLISKMEADYPQARHVQLNNDHLIGVTFISFQYV